MRYIAKFTCKSRELARMTGELLAKYHPDSNEKNRTEEDYWGICHIKEMIRNQPSEKSEMRQKFEEDIELASAIKQWEGAVFSFLKCKFDNYYDENLMNILIKKCGCKVRKKFDEKTNYLVVDFSKVTLRTLPQMLKKIYQVKETNVALTILSFSDFLSALLLRVTECIAPSVSCSYGRFEGDESDDCLEVLKEGSIIITCPCGLDSDEAYRLAEANGNCVEDYMFYVDEESCVYGIADALRYLIPKMDCMYKWTGDIKHASVLTEEEEELLELFSDMVEIEEEKYCYSRIGRID